jgi:NitT/TauT family transport system substrate-binding protein
MDDDGIRSWSRRRFLGGLALAGAAETLGLGLSSAAAEPPPEKTTIRLLDPENICQAPAYVAETFLRQEGFGVVQYVKSPGVVPYTGPGSPPSGEGALASGEADLGMAWIGPLLVRVDYRQPIAILAGVHAGCFELFGTDRVRNIHDLKGKMASAASAFASGLLLRNMLAYVGIDRADVNFVRPVPTGAGAVQLLAEGRIDAFMALPPEVQELRARKIGHVLINIKTDRPWSDYFTGMIAGNRDFVRTHPVATKRALRAILKAAEMTVQEPAHAAKLFIARKVAQRYDYALQALREIDYRRWREFDPVDSIRFYALRHHETGMVRTGPNALLAQGTDWRFLNELKREMKA